MSTDNSQYNKRHISISLPPIMQSNLMNKFSNRKSVLNGKSMMKYSYNPECIPKFIDPHINERLKSLEIFGRKEQDLQYENTSLDYSKAKMVHQDIKRHAEALNIKHILSNDKKKFEFLAKARSGKIYITELWSKKEYSEIINNTTFKTELDRLHKPSRLSLEGKVQKLDRIFNSRHKNYFSMLPKIDTDLNNVASIIKCQLDSSQESDSNLGKEVKSATAKIQSNDEDDNLNAENETVKPEHISYYKKNKSTFSKYKIVLDNISASANTKTLDNPPYESLSERYISKNYHLNNQFIDVSKDSSICKENEKLIVYSNNKENSFPNNESLDDSNQLDDIGSIVEKIDCNVGVENIILPQTNRETSIQNEKLMDNLIRKCADIQNEIDTARHSMANLRTVLKNNQKIIENERDKEKNIRSSKRLSKELNCKRNRKKNI